jgi:hypothetical protein
MHALRQDIVHRGQTNLIIDDTSKKLILVLSRKISIAELKFL